MFKKYIMITIKIKRTSGAEHTFNVYKVAVTPTNSLHKSEQKDAMPSGWLMNVR